MRGREAFPKYSFVEHRDLLLWELGKFFSGGRRNKENPKNTFKKKMAKIDVRILFMYFVSIELNALIKQRYKLVGCETYRVLNALRFRHNVIMTNTSHATDELLSL